MMADTLAFQVSPSHLPDQPPKMTRQQVFTSKIQAESSLQRQEVVALMSPQLFLSLCRLQGHWRRSAHKQTNQVASNATCNLQAPSHQAVPSLPWAWWLSYYIWRVPKLHAAVHDLDNILEVHWSPLATESKDLKQEYTLLKWTVQVQH